MTGILHFFNRIGLFFVIILCSNCGGNGFFMPSTTQLSATYSPFQMSAETYLSKAAESPIGLKQDYQLMAVGRYLHDGMLNNAKQLLDSIQPQNEQHQAKKTILTAKLYLLEHDAATTIQTLASVRNLSSLDVYYQAEYHELLALAYQMQNQISEAAAQRMKLDSLLKNPQAQLNNRQSMWMLLQEMPAPELNIQLMESTPGSIWQGWLKLAQIMRLQEFDKQWAQWEQAFPNHPANSIVQKPTRWTVGTPVQLKNPNRIALLLPLSGAFSGPGMAVKEGFMAAANQNGQSANVVIYDSAKGGAVSQYQRAVDDGSEVIVGPLVKPDAMAVASQAGTVPTLLLNDVSRSLPSNTFAFGYSPKDEAAQIAQIFHNKGYHQVMMITPSSEWGREVSGAFLQAARAQQVNVVTTVEYAQGQNLSSSIRQALAYEEYKKRNAKGKDELQVNRRKDIDAIFIVAYPSMARQIVPLLKYYYAGDIPMYATSAAYDAYDNPNQDKDLDGLQFTDIPWVFSHQVGHRNWPEPWNTYSRLYALGYDSFYLTKQWQHLQSMPRSGMSRETGVLYVMSNGHIRRELSTGQIRKGTAKETGGLLGALTN
jgi:outer membrane PBP1 activator LpoA protein